MTQYTGQCHCGDNHFQLVDTPVYQFICYCKECRVLNSGGHLCGIMFDEKQLKPAQKTTQYDYPGGSGHDIQLHFCQRCGTHLYAFPTEFPGKVVVRANVLEGIDFKPTQSLFAESAFPWDGQPINSDN